MKQQAVNPFLPSWEYIPDGEPRLFGDRVYLYGSHDRFGGKEFCMNDYVCWSAPADDLSDWRYEGMIWKRTDDPGNRDGKMYLYAPDCVQGPDGRYYLYYFLGKQFLIGVAVCDEPAGKFEFYDYVHYADGERLGEKKGDTVQFDPGVYVEGDKVYLYTGWCPASYEIHLSWGDKGQPLGRSGDASGAGHGHGKRSTQDDRAGHPQGEEDCLRGTSVF